MGFREGLENGQMAMMQIGFDHGYTSVGVKAGLALGEMRGEIDALLAFALKETSPPKKCVQEELFALQRELATFELNDMAEPDWELVHEEIKRYAYNPDASLEAKKEAWAQQQKRVHGLRARLDKCWQFWA